MGRAEGARARWGARAGRERDERGGVCLFVPAESCAVGGGARDELVVQEHKVALAGAVAQLVRQDGRERVDRRYRRARDGQRGRVLLRRRG